MTGFFGQNFGWLVRHIDSQRDVPRLRRRRRCCPCDPADRLVQRSASSTGHRRPASHRYDAGLHFRRALKRCRVAVDISQVAKLDDRAGRAARDDGRVGDPRGARGRADRRLPARGDRGTRARRLRGRRARDGRRRELQQRVGGARRAGLGLPLPPRRTTTSAARTPPGIVWKVGEGVTRWKPGDEVVIHCNQASYEDPEVHGLDPLAAPSQQIWGYETTWGSFAQFCKVQAQQLLPKPRHLTLGGGRLLRPDLLHRLPDADRPGASCRPATAC